MFNSFIFNFKVILKLLKEETSIIFYLFNRIIKTITVFFKKNNFLISKKKTLFRL